MAKVLIVIDLLNDFLDPGGALYCGGRVRDIIGPVSERIEEIRRSGGSAVFLCDAHAPDDPEFALFPAHAVKGTWGADLIPEMKSLPDGGVWYERVEKDRFSWFYGTNLEEVLARMGAMEAGEAYPVEVCGVCTSICVMDTVGDLINRRVRSQVSRSRVADLDPHQHDCALARMEKVYGARIVD